MCEVGNHLCHQVVIEIYLVSRIYKFLVSLYKSSHADLRSQIHTAIRLSITFGKFALSLAFPINYINHMLFCFFLFFCFSFFFSLRIFVYESQANPENGAMCQGYNKELSKILKLMKPDRKKINYTRTAVNTEPNCTEPRRSAGVCK